MQFTPFSIFHQYNKKSKKGKGNRQKK